jgi:homoprotocatechuate degradation regulator HpaR
MALMAAREAVMRRFRPLLAEHGLTEQQWRVLRALAAEPGELRVGELAERTFLLGPSLSRILVNLEQRSLVTREADAADGRSSCIVITPDGVELVATIAPRSEDVYHEIEAQLGPDRLDDLYRLCAALVDGAADPADLAAGPAPVSAFAASEEDPS